MLKLKKRVKDKWIKALRSGKYKQAKKSLRVDLSDNNEEDYGYCCLGVLADQCPAKTENDLRDVFLPDHILSWAFTRKSVDQFIKSQAYDKNDPVLMKNGTTASECNDDLNKSFKQIAVLIERNL